MVKVALVLSFQNRINDDEKVALSEKSRDLPKN